MNHLNGNILCVIDSETTGLDPLTHSIWQFSCIPLNFHLDPHPDIGPFDVEIQPQSEIFDPKAISENRFKHVCRNGIPSEVAANLFHEWFGRLPLGHKKRINVLAHNWPFDREFIKTWLGDASFEFYFDARYRDTLALAAALNDSCDFKANRVPFYRLTLRAIATTLGIEWDDRCAHNSLYDARKTVEVYKQLIKTTEFIHE